MPIRRGLPRKTPADAPALTERLSKEFTSPSEEGQPLVFEEPAEPTPVTRLYVVWDLWSNLNQQDRSEIILNAYEKAKGKDAALKITVAMGLTATEAERLGIRGP